MANVTFDDKNFSNNVDRLTNTLSKSKGNVLEVLGWHILGDAEPFVPMDTGDLKDSATVQAEGDAVSAGYNIRYAARLHEHPEFRFSKSAHPHAKGKWLEDTIKTNSGAYNDFIGKAIEFVIEKGTEGNGGGGKSGSSGGSSSGRAISAEELISSGKLKVTKAKFDFDKAREFAVNQSRKEERKARTY